LVSKLDQIGIKCSLHTWLFSYLPNRQQCVLIQGHRSRYRYIQAGVPQGSVLGPLLFLIYINDICCHLKSMVQLYADDTSIFHVVRHRNVIAAVNDMNTDLTAILHWCTQWLVEISTEKSVTMLISRRNTPIDLPHVKIGDTILERVSTHKHLGLWFDSKLSWSHHIHEICAKASKRVNMMLPLKHKLHRSALETIYIAYVRPVLEYGDVIFDNCTESLKSDLENIQIRASHIVTGAKRYSSHTLLYKETGWSPLHIRRQIHKLNLMQQIVHNKAPDYLTQILPQLNITRITRQTNKHILGQFQCRTEMFRRSFFPSTIDLWNNNLTETHRQIKNVASFKRANSNIFENPRLTDLQRIYFCNGDRHIQITLSQMRIQFSNLRSHLYDKQCIESPLCSCGESNENMIHFFYLCKNSRAARAKLYQSISEHFGQIPIPSLSQILNGNPDWSREKNTTLLQLIHRYIKDTKRFI